MKKQKYIKGIFFLVFLLLTACSKTKESSQLTQTKDEKKLEKLEEQEPVETKLAYDNLSNIEELEEQKLSDIIEILSFPYPIRSMLSVRYSIQDLKSDGMAELIRRNRGKYYSVTRIEDGRYLFLLYYGANEEQNDLIDGFLVSTLADKTWFKTISKGMKQEKILKHDPSAYIATDGKYSYHRFSDKSILEIKYKLKNKQFIVSEFQFLEDQISVLDYLLPKDFEKIFSENDKEEIENNQFYTISLDEKEWDIIKYDNESNIEELREQKFSDKIKRLALPYSKRIHVPLIYDTEILKSDGIAELIRFHNDRYYSVTRIKGGRYLFLLYDGTRVGEDRLIDGFLVSTLADKTWFKTISKGMKQEKILKHDPSAYTAADGKYSYHRFSDKSILEIKYKLKNKQFIVSEFQFLEDQISVLDYLLPEDFEKIS